MTRKLPRGHSNVYAEETEPYPTFPEKAMIPMIDGAHVDTCRLLPPLALSKQEWETIGRKMGWLPMPRLLRKGGEA